MKDYTLSPNQVSIILYFSKKNGFLVNNHHVYYFCFIYNYIFNYINHLTFH